MIAKRLLEEAEPYMEGLTVADVRIGLGYTAVLNSRGGLGLACTLRHRLKGGCSVFKRAGTLLGIPLADAASMILENDNPVAVAVGLASVNSLSSFVELDGEKGDILDSVTIGRDQKVVMIGHFAPVEKGIRDAGAKLEIFEDRNEPSEFPFDERYMESLSRCDVAVITATSILNGTVDAILSAVPEKSVKVLLGPSTPLFPGAFEGKADFLSGMIPEDIEAVLNIVSQGGGTCHFKKFSRKINIRAKG